MKKIINLFGGKECFIQLILDQWRFEHFKNCPELLASYVMPATVKAYLIRLEQHDKLQHFALIQWNSIVYYLNRIGVNVNQLAHRANQGGQVDVEELQKITQATMNLSQIINNKFKESGADVREK